MTLRLGLRLAVAGGRTTLVGHAVTVVGVAVGVVLLLLSLTGQSAAEGRAERSGWRSATVDTPATAPDPALFLSVTDYHDGATLSRTYVAALGPEPPVPPGLDRLPGPGEVAVSPAMRRLLASTPDDELDDRYPGRIVATIGDAGLAHSDDLVALVGRTPDQLAEVESEALETVRGFGERPSDYGFVVGLRVFLAIGAVLLLVPVVVFIVTATRVAAAQREQRLGAIRLVGATRLQTATVAAVDTGLAAVAGSLLGWAGYEVGRRILAATVVFDGGHFFVDDVVVEPWLLVLVLAGVPLVAMLTTVLTLGRVQAGPLAARRGARRPRLTARRALPFAIGIGGQLAAGPFRDATGSDVLDRLTPLLVLSSMVGFLLIGPWLCLLAGRGLARVSRRVPGLLAARRLASDPHATFRGISGVVVAAFAVTYSASLIDQVGATPYDGGIGELRPGVVAVTTGGVPEDRVAPLLDDGTVAVRFEAPGAPGLVVESCEELARVVVLSCAGPVEGPVGLSEGFRSRPGLDETDTDMAIAEIYVPTDGSPAAENRVRTQAANLVPNAIIHIQADRVDNDAVYLHEVGELLRIGWQFVLVVAACSLTVGMIAGILERRRPFALLRASGLRLGELRRVVFLETGAAMLITAAVGVGLGLVASYALAVFRDLRWTWPDPGVFALIGAGVGTALLLTTVALPLLDVTTRHDAVRYE